MKICFIAGADSLHSYKWIKYFADKKYEIHWISFTPYTQNKIEGINFYFLKGSPFKKYFAIKKILKEIKPDILHAHYVGFNGFFGALTKFHPFVLTAWGSDILLNSRSRIKRPLIKFALNDADLVTCNGEPLKKEMLRMGIDDKKIKFVYWATDISQFKSEINNKELEEKMEIFEFPAIISLRSLEPIYDIETLIQSFPLVLKQFPQAKLIIAGEGSQKSKLESLADSLMISPSVKFIGWIPHEDISKYLNSVDIYVSTSLSDGDLSQGTQQAMACELPIITTDLEVNKKRIKDEFNGIIFPKKDYNLLAEKIIMLLKDENLRNKLGKEGRKTIEEKLNFHKEMKEAEELYKKLMVGYKK